MQITTVLFDLDGTLLPMDQDEFVKYYFGLLAKKLAPHGYDPQTLIKAIWAGTGAMVKNDGSCTNEEAFWNCFTALMGEDARKDEPLFREFYEKEFSDAKAACGFNPEAAKAVYAIRDKGYHIVLATNPLFPAIATRQRIRWAGLEPEDFQFVTTYENSRFCKPNPEYYRDLLDKLGKDPESCLMVGNDVDEDMIPARAVGMEVFLLTDCLLNRSGADISSYPQGGFAELKDFLLRKL